MLREQEKLQFLRQLRRSVDPDVPWAGYYCAGEIGPVENTTTIICTRRLCLPLVDDGMVTGSVG